jgi:YbgC/YbaW family acyl-CoA thioester hydrolase
MEFKHPFSTPRTVSFDRYTLYSEVDHGQIMHFGVAFRYVEQGFCAWFKQFSLFSLNRWETERGIQFAVREITTTYKKPIFCDECISVEARVSKLTPVSVPFEIFLRRGQEVCVEVKASLISMNQASRKLQKLPPDFLAHLSQGRKGAA